MIGQWAVDSGQWAVGSGQWAVGSRQWAVGSGQPAFAEATADGVGKPSGVEGRPQAGDSRFPSEVEGQ